MKRFQIFAAALFLTHLACVNSVPTRGVADASTGTPPALTQATEEGPPPIEPGRSIGRISLGMTRPELEKLGLPVASTDISRRLAVGPFFVALDAAGTVIHIEVDVIKTGLMVNRDALAPQISFDALRAALPNCGEVVDAEGGKFASCAGGIRVAAGGPAGIVQVSLDRAR